MTFVALAFSPAFGQEPPAPVAPAPEQRRLEDERRAQERKLIEEQRRMEERRLIEEQKRAEQQAGELRRIAETQIDDQGQMKIYEIKWRDPEEIKNLLEPFVAFGGARPFARADRAFKTVTVRGKPETLALIDNLIQKFDVPSRELEFQFFLLRGRKTGTGIKDGVPDEISKVLEDVSSLTMFKAFDLIDSPTVRATEGRPVSVDSKGDIFGRIEVSAPALVVAGNGPAQIRIDRFQLRCEFPVPVSWAKLGPDKPEQKVEAVQYRSAGIETSFRIADGETIVVGSSKIPDSGGESGDAVIAVMKAKVVK
jgi:hypothetical protein